MITLIGGTVMLVFCFQNAAKAPQALWIVLGAFAAAAVLEGVLATRKKRHPWLFLWYILAVSLILDIFWLTNGALQWWVLKGSGYWVPAAVTALLLGALAGLGIAALVHRKAQEA